MDFEAMDELAEETAEKLFGGQKTDRAGSCADRFFGAATVNGSYDYIPNITQEIPKRYFLKGRPGTGKSTFLKMLARAAQDRGYRTEAYHCAFDPNSLDMIAVRELGLCVFDSTAPHEYFPDRDSDEIIDIYKAAVQREQTKSMKRKSRATARAIRPRCGRPPAIWERRSWLTINIRRAFWSL